MQFDLFHVYTVDQHTLAVLRNLARFASGIVDERFSIAHEVWPRLRKPELLLLAGLFHDIAKGRGGDHSELGADDARIFCSTIGLSRADTALVEWLVRQHLLMSVTAQKQDIADPEVIHRFAGKVADRERLDHLYLLTCADIAGTSPEVVERVEGPAAGRPLHRHAPGAAARPRASGRRRRARRRDPRRRARDAGHARLRRRRGRPAVRAHARDRFPAQPPRSDRVAGRHRCATWPIGETRVRARAVGEHAGALEVFVHSPDRDGLFAAIVATLDRLGLAIQQARVLDGPERHDLRQLRSRADRSALPADASRRSSSAWRAALAGPLDRIKPTRRAQPRHLRHFRIAAQVGFDTLADDRHAPC